MDRRVCNLHVPYVWAPIWKMFGDAASLYWTRLGGDFLYVSSQAFSKRRKWPLMQMFRVTSRFIVEEKVGNSEDIWAFLRFYCDPRVFETDFYTLSLIYIRIFFACIYLILYLVWDQVWKGYLFKILNASVSFYLD